MRSSIDQLKTSEMQREHTGSLPWGEVALGGLALFVVVGFAVEVLLWHGHTGLGLAPRLLVMFLISWLSLFATVVGVGVAVVLLARPHVAARGRDRAVIFEVAERPWSPDVAVTSGSHPLHELQGPSNEPTEMHNYVWREYGHEFEDEDETQPDLEEGAFPYVVAPSTGEEGHVWASREELGEAQHADSLDPGADGQIQPCGSPDKKSTEPTLVSQL